MAPLRNLQKFLADYLPVLRRESLVELPQALEQTSSLNAAAAGARSVEVIPCLLCSCLGHCFLQSI